jgi:hypothetical protein
MLAALGQAEASGTLGGSGLASWTSLYVLLGGFMAIVVTLTAFGRSNPRWGGFRILSRAPDSLHRLTGVPGWAATAVGTALVGLLVAGEGFYSDVAWHIAFGRDDDLFTAPHTGILVGLVLLFAGAALGTLVATLDRVPGTLLVGALRVPRSLVPLWALSIGALIGFPTDEIWHREYGIDVTMWSPTHMLMILGATFTGLALWLVLGEAGVQARASRWGRAIHVVCAALTLQALAAPLGEFNFGVPQFRQLFAPILVSLAAGVALTASRIVHGRGWTLGIVAGMWLLGLGDDGPVATRSVGVFLASALCVEVAAWVVGTDRRLRFALVAGAGVGTFGLAGEWLWNQGAYQPWTSALLPEAVVFGLVAAIAGAVLGAAMSPAIQGEAGPGVRLTGPVVGVALAAALAVVVLPLPRSTGDVTAAVHLEPAGEGTAFVEATLSPADAGLGAEWFQVSAWQGGGLELAAMEPTGETGAYRSEEAVPVDGYWKTLLRLHRGDEMMAVPVYLPADPSIDEPAIPAVDRTAPFESERRYLLRETRPGNGWMSPAVHGLLVIVCAGWALAFRVALRRPGAPLTTGTEPAARGGRVPPATVGALRR